MTTNNLVDNIEKIINSKGYAGVDLDYITKTSFYSIWDLLRILQTKYNKLKTKLGRFEWIRSLKERIDERLSDDSTFGLVHELDIQDLDGSDKAYLHHHFGFPMFLESAYKRSKAFREAYDQKLLELSECLNDEGLDDLASDLLGMDFDEFSLKIDKLETTITTITETVNTVLENNPHFKLLMKSQLRDICIKCKKLRKKKAFKIKKKAEAEKRVERRERGNTFYLKSMHFVFYKRDYLPKTDYDCMRELFELLRVEDKELNDFIKIKKNNRNELHFIVSGRVTCEILWKFRNHENKGFLNILESFWRPHSAFEFKRNDRGFIDL